MLKEACVAANVLLCPELINGITGPTLFSSSIWAPQTFDGTVHLPSDKACKLQPLRQPDVVRRERGEERLVRPHLARCAEAAGLRGHRIGPPAGHPAGPLAGLFSAGQSVCWLGSWWRL